MHIQDDTVSLDSEMELEPNSKETETDAEERTKV